MSAGNPVVRDYFDRSSIHTRHGVRQRWPSRIQGGSVEGSHLQLYEAWGLDDSVGKGLH
jgi:hypothetical protein